MQRRYALGEYPENWPEIAEQIKEQAGWKCEHCGHPHDVATWHVLTVHHLDLDKANCNLRNLVALCQCCHLSIQAKYIVGQGFLPGMDPPVWAVSRELLSDGKGENDDGG